MEPTMDYRLKFTENAFRQDDDSEFFVMSAAVELLLEARSAQEEALYWEALCDLFPAAYEIIRKEILFHEFTSRDFTQTERKISDRYRLVFEHPEK